MTATSVPILVPLEQVITTEPFTLRREVRWADCDPAGVVFTGKFSDYALSATSLFRRHLLGARWTEVGRAHGIDTPAKALSLVFQGPLWPDDLTDITVWVGEIRTRTFDMLLQAVRADTQTPVFLGRLTTICISATERMVSKPWPEPYLAPFTAYQNRHTVPDTLKKMGP
jgi:acyl-CoA thioesterase FadM